MSGSDVEAAIRRITGAATFICFSGKNFIPSKISFSVSGLAYDLSLQPRLNLSQVSADRRALEYKKGKLSVLSESMDVATLEATFERTEGFPKDCNPAHVS